MRKTRTEQRTIEVTAEIICDRCGKQCDEEYATGYYNAGFNSQHYGDGCEVKFEICETCLWDITRTFKHVSEVDYQPHGEEILI